MVFFGLTNTNFRCIIRPEKYPEINEKTELKIIGKKEKSTMWDPVVVQIVLWGLPLELRLFGLFALLVGACAYPPYIKAMVQRKQSPPRSTWWLWFALDAVAFSSKLSSGNFDAMLFIYTIGTFFVACFTIPYGEKGWKKIETFCVICVLAAIVVWIVFGAAVATVCSLIGITVAMYPLLIRVLRGEYEDILSWCIVLASSLMNLADGQLLVSIWIIILQLTVLCSVTYYWKYLPRKQR